MRGRVAVLAIVLIGTAVACSVVDDGKVERIDPQFGLDTLPSSTFLETTTTQQATTTIALETTTPVTVVPENVRLYFVTSGQLNYVLKPLPTPVALPQIIAALQLGPPEDTGYRTIVPSGSDVVRVSSDGTGVANVTLQADFFQLVDVSDQRLVIAQLVLTLTKSSGIGQVVFNLTVPLPSGTGRPAGQKLTFADYESMLTDSPIVPDPIVPDPTGPATTTSTTINE